MEVLKDELLLRASVIRAKRKLARYARWDNSFNLLNHLGVQP